MKVLSALPGKEKERFPLYLKEIIYWGETDENISKILENLQTDKKE